MDAESAVRRVEELFLASNDDARLVTGAILFIDAADLGEPALARRSAA